MTVTVTDHLTEEEVIKNAEYNRILNEAGVTERYYNTYGAAWFLGKKEQWIYWNLRQGKFRYPGPVDPDTKKPLLDENGNEILGELIEPTQVGRGKKRIYTLPIIREMALSAYRRGRLKKKELAECLLRIEAESSGKSLVPEEGRQT